MANFKIPNSVGQIRQVPFGDVLGELWSTFGIDLTTSQGKMKVSKRLSPTLSTAKTDNDDVQAFVVFGGEITAFADGGRRMRIDAYRNPRISGSWTSSSGALDIGQETDAVVFGGAILLSTGTNIARSTDNISYDDDWWTAVVSGTALTTGKPHTMDVSRIGAETLFVTDGNVIRYYNATAGHTAITLASHLTACCLATDYKATWVGTYTNDGSAYVYEIYIGDTLPRNAYEIDGTAVLSMDVVDGNVFIVTDRGHIQTFNGVAFVTIASFPFAFEGVNLAGLSLGDINDANNARAIHPKGMRRDGRNLLININTNNQLIVDLATNPNDDDDEFENVVVNERSPSGVWEFNIDTKVLNHRFPLQATSDSKGFHRQQKSGPILVTNNQYTKLLTAGRVVADRVDVLAEDPLTTPFAYFITPEIDSTSVQDAWEKLALKHNDLIDGESIEIKYRTTKNRDYPKYSEANWLDAESFVVTNDISTVAVGDEVEVIDGYGAGSIAHVTEITSSTSTYTVRLDREIGEANEVNQVRFQNWTLTTLEDLTNHQILGTEDVSTWVQFKVVLTGFIEIRELINKGTVKTEM